jgi:NACHT domain
MAGTGKSTLARTIADSFAKKKLLGASFFFSRGRGDLGYARKFFTTIAAQLAGKVPFLRYQISKTIAENPQIIREGLGEQWKHLILYPLLQLEERSLPPQTLVLVIDALDECQGKDDVRLLLRLLPEINGLRGLKVRIFITSRPENPILCGFRQMSKDAHQDFPLHNIDQVTAQHDIFIFLSHELEDIRRQFCLHQGWPSNDSIQILVHRASGLFIYAATACRFIRRAKYSSPEDRLTLLLQAPIASSPDGTLDEIYTQVLERSILGDSDGQKKIELGAKFREIVGPIVVLFDTLASAPLAKLISSPERIILAVLGDLHSVLNISDSQDHLIQLLHPSFRDFLLDSNRCPNPFWIDQRKIHEDLAKSCLRVMSDCLKKDICSLETPGVLSSTVSYGLIKQCLPKELQYACRYWVEHLQRSETLLYNDGEIYSFLQKHLLHWLEALSLMGRTSEGVLAIISLESHIPVSPFYSILDNPN